MSMSHKCPYCDKEIPYHSEKCSCSQDILHSYNLGKDYIVEALSSKYKILSELGAGGMAVVYKAIQLNLNREVALKIIHPNIAKDKDFLSHFHQEAIIGANLNHQHIVTTYDEGHLNGIHYIVMEYLHGMTLDEIVKKKGKLEQSETINYTLPIARALEYAHKEGVIHSDIKSANIFITDNGIAKLTDFGIAKILNQHTIELGDIAGTPEFMSPEQIDGVETDHRSDLYSLGVVMYHCLEGKTPYGAENPMLTINRILYGTPDPLNVTVSKNIRALIEELLSKEPARRPQSAAEVISRITNNSFIEPKVKSNNSNQSIRKSPHFVISSNCTFNNEQEIEEYFHKELVRDNHVIIGRLSNYDSEVFPWYKNLPVYRYKAWDTIINKVVCLNVFNENADGNCRNHFTNTFNILSSLNHKNIIKVVNKSRSWNEYTTEYIFGRKLNELIKEKRYLAVDETLKIIDQLLDLCIYLNEKGIQCLDLTSDKIIITYSGEVKLIDVSNYVYVLTTDIKPNILAPEYKKYGNTKRTEQFLLGTIIYECLTGEYPFYPGCTGTPMSFITYEPITTKRKHIPLVLDEITKRCLKHEPEQRFESFRQIRELFQNYFPDIKNRSENSTGQIKTASGYNKKLRQLYKDFYESVKCTREFEIPSIILANIAEIMGSDPILNNHFERANSLLSFKIHWYNLFGFISEDYYHFFPYQCEDVFWSEYRILEDLKIENIYNSGTFLNNVRWKAEKQEMIAKKEDHFFAGALIAITMDTPVIYFQDSEIQKISNDLIFKISCKFYSKQFEIIRKIYNVNSSGLIKA